MPKLDVQPANYRVDQSGLTQDIVHDHAYCRCGNVEAKSSALLHATGTVMLTTTHLFGGVICNLLVDY